MSERNGRICCLRVIVVKLAPGQTAADLPHQSELRISTHDAVQSSPWGAYIAEILGASFMGRDVLVGDGQNILSREVGNLDCPACRVGATAELLKAVRAQENKKRRFARSTGFASAMDERVEDGFLDPEANYTAFVEIIIPGGQSASVGRDAYPIQLKCYVTTERVESLRNREKQHEKEKKILKRLDSNIMVKLIVDWNTTNAGALT